MGKPSKRPGRAARDVHALIAEQAAAIRHAPPGLTDASEFPEIDALLHAGREAVAAGVPRFVFFKGRNYWLRVRLAVQLDVFANRSDATPLLCGLSFSTEDAGYQPGSDSTPRGCSQGTPASDQTH